jgi:uncharacterized protein
MRRRLLLLIAAAAATVATGGHAASKCLPRDPRLVAAAATLPAPALTGRVVDDAHILSGAARGRLDGRLAALERRTTDQVVVVTLPNLGGAPIERVGMALGNHWHIGRAGLDNGVLLIVAPNDRKVRIEVGCGLEGLLTDARAAAIIQDRLLPLLRARAYDRAAEAGVAAIARILESDLRRPRPRRGDGA